MNCERIKELIPLYLAGMLTEEDLKEFESHLSTCKECQRHLKLEKQIEKDLADFFEGEYKKQSPVFSMPKTNSNSYAFKKIALAVAATLILAISILFLKNENKSATVVSPQIQTVKINSPKIRDIVFIDGKLETRVQNLGNNVYLVQIQGGKND